MSKVCGDPAEGISSTLPVRHTSIRTLLRPIVRARCPLLFDPFDYMARIMRSENVSPGPYPIRDVLLFKTAGFTFLHL
jgi:hypothetical protein